MAPIELKLVGQDNSITDALVRSFIPVVDVLSWYADWFPLMFDLARNRLYSDSHWKITDYFEEIHEKDGYDVVILEAENKIQGYVTIKYDYKNVTCGNCNYIPFIASAPWNRKNNITGRREFKNIGKILLATAAIYGFKKNGSKELMLHSLRSAEKYYESLGMTQTGQVKEQMKEYYMNEATMFELVRFSKQYFKLKSTK